MPETYTPTTSTDSDSKRATELVEDSPPLSYFITFLCVVKFEGYSKAAKRLGLTQGAVSKQIDRLEEWCGDKLFTSNRPPKLTEHGKTKFMLISDGVSRILSSSDHINSYLSENVGEDDGIESVIFDILVRRLKSIASDY